MSWKEYNGRRAAVQSVRAHLPSLQDTVRATFCDLAGDAAVRLAAHTRYEWELATATGISTDCRLEGVQVGSVFQRSVLHLDAVSTRLAHGGRRQPADDFGLTVSFWFDPSDAAWMLARVNTEHDLLRVAAEEHLGSIDWGYWDDSDADDAVSADEWTARRTSWRGLGDTKSAVVWSFDHSSALWSLLHTRPAVTAEHVDALGGVLGVTDADGLVRVLTGDLDAPISSGRLEVLRRRARERGAAARTYPLDVCDQWGNARALVRALHLIDRDQPWREVAD